MPLHDVGYRSWQGDKSWASTRWWVIATTGIQLAFRSTWLSRTLVLSWVPALVVGVWFFFYEQSISSSQFRNVTSGLVQTLGAPPDLSVAIRQNPEAARHEVWSTLMLAFFRYPQSVLMLVLVGIIAPRLIAYDLRNRGYLLYFSRPIRISGYVLGKSVIIWTFLSLITTLPALALYVVGLSLAPTIDVFWSTWDIPIRILGASVVLMIPTASVALACSAMTIETRYAAFSWFALWIVGWVSYSVLRLGELAGQDRPRGAFRRRQAMSQTMEQSDWELLSPFHVLGRVQQYVFGLYPEDQSIWHYCAILVVVTIVSLLFIARQLRVRLRA